MSNQDSFASSPIDSSDIPPHIHHESPTFHNDILNWAIDGTPLLPVHWRIWILSSMGIFLEGYNLFVIGIALPLIAHHYHITASLQGMIGAAAIAGTIIGSFSMGQLADRFGRKPFYITNLVLVIFFALLSSISPNIHMLIICQFLLGIGVGADYPICASYVSEFMPARIRGRMLLATFSFQAAGMVAAALLGLLILKLYPHDNAWRIIIALGALPAVIILIFRTQIPESPRWCLEHNQIQKAVDIIKKIIPAQTTMVEHMLLKEKKKILKQDEKELGITTLFQRKYLRRTVLATVPWFLMDIATYGVGIFTPTILAAVHLSGQGSFLSEDFLATEGAAFIDIFLVIGFILNLFLVDRWGRIRLQLMGFAGMVTGLLLLAFGALLQEGTITNHLHLSASSWLPHGSSGGLILIFTGFILYNLLMNLGPNATTFILAAELFPTKLRASAHGFAGAVAKIGATMGIFLLPILKSHIGIPSTMGIIAAAAACGFILTFLFRIETKGKSLEELQSWKAAEAFNSKHTFERRTQHHS